MTRFTPLWLQSGSYAASVDRRLIGALYPNPAVNGMAVTAAGGMAINIAAGQAAVPSPNQTGTVLCTSDNIEQVTLTQAPGTGAGNRIDLITVHPRGTDYDGDPTNNDFIMDFVTGVVAASPVAPAVPNGQLALAQVYVGGGVAAIVAGNITDRRPVQGLAVQPAWPPNHPGVPLVAFRVNGVTSQTITQNVWTQLTTAFGAAAPEYNIGGGTWAGQQYTIPHRGLYRINSTVRWNLSGTTFTGVNRDFIGTPYIDGVSSGINGAVNISVLSQGSNAMFSNGIGSKILNAGQKVDLRCWQNTVAAYAIAVGQVLEIIEEPIPV